MDSLDVRPEQAERLFATTARMLDWQHRLLARLDALDFPADDPLYRACRESVAGLRELYLAANDHRRKGLQRRALRRAKGWPPLR